MRRQGNGSLSPFQFYHFIRSQSTSTNIFITGEAYAGCLRKLQDIQILVQWMVSICYPQT